MRTVRKWEYIITMYLKIGRPNSCGSGKPPVVGGGAWFLRKESALCISSSPSLPCRLHNSLLQCTSRWIWHPISYRYTLLTTMYHNFQIWEGALYSDFGSKYPNCDLTVLVIKIVLNNCPVIRNSTIFLYSGHFWILHIAIWSATDFAHITISSK